jgi:hypothetical protein
MNRYGQWVHIDTIDLSGYLLGFPPPLWTWESWLSNHYGPGKYDVAVVEEHMSGMRHHASFTIGYDLEYLEWVPEMPTPEYLNQKWLGGDYYICRASDVKAFAVPRQLNGGESVFDVLEQGISALTAVYLIFRVKGIPYGQPTG